MMKINKIVLAYSGGLDTSIILKWLQDEYQCEVVTFTANIGQRDNHLKLAHKKAVKYGIKEIYMEDLQEEFARDYIYPMFRGNAIYEGEYLLGTSISRPLIAKYLVKISREIGADAISHGATGQGNDQVRFELASYALDPSIIIITPWREWNLTSRETLMEYAKSHNIEIENNKRSSVPYSKDENLLHISYEGCELDDPWVSPSEDMWEWTVSPQNAPDIPEEIILTYSSGDIIAVDRKKMIPKDVIKTLNASGMRNGIGRSDIVENRYVGIKSRGCYETPAGTIMLKAHRAIESITLDREVAHLKEALVPRYAQLIYSGYWFSPERKLLQQMIDLSQNRVNGEVNIRLYKGNIEILGRRSEKDSLFDENLLSFEHASELYNQADATGFIRLNAIRMRIAAMNGR